ncbi:uncharacterized protein LOC127867523 [Dreissena polymorpha]|uniref:Uncharacterized protein n=1 Tax=Dreissena polymorpha TaxID=45954 RepID=A0A9D4M0J5_DREPO|nr:uncharacterized protein LOC127867523 [Dreissena polymorpha]KAH3867396.1 hypothetical protein DPMN_030522 [Dreissena polymorpha]
MSSSARQRTARLFAIQGQGYPKLDHDPGGAAAASHVGAMASHAFPSDSETEGDEGMTPVLVDELTGINRTLEKQIETLRLRLDFDSRHHEAEKHALLVETGAKLKAKTEEIDIMKNQLIAKDSKVKEIEKDNERKSNEISALRREIETLNNDVVGAKAYANDLMSQMSALTREKEKLEREGVFGDKELEMLALRKEVSDLKSNLTMLEDELSKARDLIATQGNKLKLVDSDKKSLQFKFKEELARVSHSMRMEVERMRDVMKKQWEEMRSLREQNFSMSKDIKDIRSLLINGCLDDDSKLQQQQEEGQGHPQGNTTVPGQFASAHQVALPQTARGSKQTTNGFNMGALKPSLPVLNKESGKKTTNRRK